MKNSILAIALCAPLLSAMAHAEISSTVKTDHSYGDIADASVWVSASGDKSWLLAALEGDGFAVFDRAGKQLGQFFESEKIEIQGSDVRYDITDKDGGNIDIVALGKGKDVSFFIVTGDAKHPIEGAGSITTDIEPEVVCLYKNPTTGELAVTVSEGDDRALQYKLMMGKDNELESVIKAPSGKALPVREITVGGEISGCAVDDATRTLYIAEQNLGIWAYGADPENIKDRRLIDVAKPLGQVEEIEGIDIAYLADGTAQLWIADEGQGMLRYNLDEEGAFIDRFTVKGFEEHKGLAIGANTIWLANTELEEPLYERITAEQVGIEGMKSKRDLAVEDVALVRPTAETSEVEDDGDAADDSAIWVNSGSPEKSLIIATNKQGGLMAYNIEGEELQYINEGNPNNVDIRQNIEVEGGEPFDLAAVTNRDNNTIALYRVNSADSGKDVLEVLPVIGGAAHSDVPEIASKISEIYGFCLYQNTQGEVYAFANGKSGDYEQWKLMPKAEGVEAELVRQFSVATQPEGCVADDKNGVLYVGEENVGIWSFDAAEDASIEATEFAKIDGKTLVDDVEGLTLYADGDTQYLIASSQGNNTYAIYNTTDKSLVGIFAIMADDAIGVDGASDTDGIAVTATPLGAKYPAGLFVAQDYYNVDSEYSLENQNFKLVSWQDIIDAVK